MPRKVARRGFPYGQALDSFYQQATVQWVTGSAHAYRKVFRYQQATPNWPLNPKRAFPGRSSPNPGSGGKMGSGGDGCG